MSLLNKLGVSYGTLFIVAVVCSLISLSTANISRQHLTRADLAHGSYEAHLRLSNSVDELFDEVRIAYELKRAINTQKTDNLVVAIREDIEIIRQAITGEIVIVGEGEVEELGWLSVLEAKINDTISNYQQIVDAENNSSLANQEVNSQLFTGQDAEASINADIKKALEEETREVEETRQEALETLQLTKALAGLFTVLAISSLIYSFFLIRKELLKPLRSIVEGSQKFASGDYSHEIDLPVSVELKQIADALNKATSLAAARERELRAINQTLEREVASQTKELRQTVLVLEEQKRERQRFLADVSHELRTPLTVIQGEADIALRGGDKEITTYKEALLHTSEAARHTTQLVSDLLFISRQESGHAALNLQKLDLVEMVGKTIESMRVTLGRYSAKCEFLPLIPTAKVSIDVNRIRQVIMILIENACQYGGKNITFNIKYEDGGIALSVKDDGPGINSSEQPHIFERFFRGSNAAERYDAGAGLGLPVAKSIVEAHSGTISAISSPGEGTEFLVILPHFKPLKAVS